MSPDEAGPGEPEQSPIPQTELPPEQASESQREPQVTQPLQPPEESRQPPEESPQPPEESRQPPEESPQPPEESPQPPEEPPQPPEESRQPPEESPSGLSVEPARAARVKGAAVILAALAALAATVGLPYTKWYWADVARGALSALIILLVLRVAAGDQAGAIRARESAEAEKTAKRSGRPAPAVPALPRRRLYIWICVIFGLGSMVYNVVSFMRPDPECGGNPARVLTRGPDVRIGEAEGRRGDVDLLKGRVAALCVAQAKDAATSTALGMTVAIALVGSAIYDATRPVPAPWTKIAWFTYFGFFGTPPARWQLNFWFITGGLALGMVLVSLLVSRTRVVDDKAKLDIPGRKLAATGLVAALVAGGGAKVLNDRNESACKAAEERGPAANRPPQLDVSRSLPAADRKAIEEVATSYFTRFIVEEPGRVEEAAAAARIDKLARVGGVGFALFTYEDNLETIRGIGAIVRRTDGWSVGDIQTAVGWDGPIQEGSNAFGFLPHSNQGLSALGGYIDPSAGRIETVDACSRLIDTDKTTAQGAALVIVPAGGGQLRGMRAGELVGALPIAGEEVRGPSKAPGATARARSDAFVDGLLEDGWPGASRYVAGRAAESVVRPFGKLLAGNWRRSGSANAAGATYRYSISGKQGSAQLIVQMTDHSARGWAVASVAFARPPITSA